MRKLNKTSREALQKSKEDIIVKGSGLFANRKQNTLLPSWSQKIQGNFSLAEHGGSKVHIS